MFQKQKRDSFDYNLKISGEKIERETKMKYLGVTLDDKLYFDEDVSTVHSKAVKKLGLIRKSRHFLDQSILLMLYQSLLLQQLNYCDMVYDTRSVVNKNKLQIVQNCALRTILNCDKYTSIDYLHNKVKILTLPQRHKLHTAVECFKNVKVKKTVSITCLRNNLTEEQPVLRTLM